jgi:membrane-associated phospholipid phosphatase
MKVQLASLLAAMVFGLPGQTLPAGDQSKDQQAPPPQQEAQQNNQSNQKPPGKAHNSTIEVKPGGQVIKQKDLWDASGYVHPFVRMPKYILQDQKAIWTSPFHTAKKDIKFWAIFGGVTTALIATDKSTVKWLPDSSSQISVSTWASRFGQAYFLVPVSAGFYFFGTGNHNDRLRETGLIGFETLLNSAIVVEAVKLAADRARPLTEGGRGEFEAYPGNRWSSSFPSGHAIAAWSMASVIAHQYPHPRIVPIIVYGLASTVVVSRVGARQHFPGDVLAGSAMGWFIGDYVYGRRHNNELDHKPTAAERILDHVHLGTEFQTSDPRFH